MSRILVTGGAGFIGHHLINRLVEQGHECIALDSGRSGRWSQVNHKAEKLDLALENQSDADFVSLLADVDIVFHLAAEKYNSSSMTPERVIEVNIQATDRLFRACAEAGVKRVVFTSSLYAYGTIGPKVMAEDDVTQPWTHYGISKLAGEHLLRGNLRSSNTAFNIARLFFIYGPEQFAEGGYKSVVVKNFENILSSKPVTINGDGEQELDYVYVDDCVEALICLAESPAVGFTVNIASGQAYKINEVVRTMTEVSDRAFVPELLAPDWTAGTSRVGNPRLMSQAFSWTAKTSLREGLAKTWAWFEGKGE